MGEHIVFKGGTSLSKVYRLIDRFSEDLPIRFYLGDHLDQPIGVAGVRSPAAERTFWEKATLLHAEAHRDLAKPMPTRYARHYHDLARMAAEPVAARALADTALR